MRTHSMDPSEGEIALRRLAAAEEAVARARDLAARQREIVARLESARHDTTHARQLLGMFETIRARDLAGRQREIVARVESARHDTTQARQLLGMFETIRANHERRRAMLLDELTHCGWKHVT